MGISNLSRVAGAVAIALGTGIGSAEAGVIIDLFNNTPLQTVTADGAVGDTDSNQLGPLPATSVLGQYRDLAIEKTAGDEFFTAVARAGLSGGVGRLSISNDEGVASTTVVTWDGSNVAGVGGSTVNTQGLNNANLTFGGADQFLANVIRADLGFSYVLKVWDMDGDYSFLSASVQFPVTPAMGATAHYLFDWFNLGTGSYCDGAATPPAATCPASPTQLQFDIERGKVVGTADGTLDFSKIGALQLVLFSDPLDVNTLSADFALGTIRTVPEPGVLALVGAALIGLTAANRRRKPIRA